MADVAELKEFCNGLLNQGQLKWAKGCIYAGNISRITSINLTLVVLDRDSDTLLAEDAPVFFG